MNRKFTLAEGIFLGISGFATFIMGVGLGTDDFKIDWKWIFVPFMIASALVIIGRILSMGDHD